MQKKIYFHNYKAKPDGILEIVLSLEIASDNFLLQRSKLLNDEWGLAFFQKQSCNFCGILP